MVNFDILACDVTSSRLCNQDQCKADISTHGFIVNAGFIFFTFFKLGLTREDASELLKKCIEEVTQPQE